MSTNETFLFLMLGFPGSGKSYVADWLAPHMKAVHLRSDDMRLKMFGDGLEFHKNPRYQRQVREAMQYAATQILIAGHSVVYDANHTLVKHRSTMRRVAEGLGVVPVLVWVKAPLDLAKQRVLEREAAGGLRVFELDFVDRMAGNLEPPASNELYIQVYGTKTSSEQQAAFEERFAAILSGKVQ